MRPPPLDTVVAVEVFDTTLRDGTQREGISLSCADKIRIAEHLDSLGVGCIEGGWPGSNPKDVEFFERARELEWTQAKIVAFGSTCRAGVPAEEDAGLTLQLDAGTEVVCLFGKSWTLHVTEVLRCGLEENLRMVRESVARLHTAGRRVIYDAEHFFDGYRADPVYAVETLRAAAEGGASVITLCDTNGGSLPWEVEAIVRDVATALPGPVLGIHAHDDTGCAVANTLAAVRAGARHIQGTLNGYGERCGNANLCVAIPDLELKLGLSCLPNGLLPKLYDVAHAVAEIANLSPDEHMPYVGRSAFAHKAGVHVSAMRRHPDSYQHVEPGLVGNEMRVVVSELSGRSNLRSTAETLGLDVDDSVDAAVLTRIKAEEARGFSFEAAQASVELMMMRSAEDYALPFRVLDYKVLVGHSAGATPYAEATVKLSISSPQSPGGSIGDHLAHTAAEGDGPVEALDRALRKALAPHYPEVARIQLKDYKVRILDGHRATAATTRVLIDSTDGRRSWSTVGASSNIIEASVRALTESIEYGLSSLRAQALEAAS